MHSQLVTFEYLLTKICNTSPDQIDHVGDKESRDNKAKRQRELNLVWVSWYVADVEADSTLVTTTGVLLGLVL